MLKKTLYSAGTVITHDETHIGTGLCIDQTVNDKVDLLKVTGDSWQNKVAGNNLADYEHVKTSAGNSTYYERVGNGFILTAHKKESGDRIAYVPCNLKAGNTYIVSFDTEILEDYGGVNIVRVYLKDTSQYFQKGKPIIPSGDVTILGIYTDYKNYEDGNDVKILVSNIMVNEGSNVMPWEPYTGGIPSPNQNYPSKIKSVSGELKSFGRNLYSDPAYVHLPNSNGNTITLPELRAIRDGDGNIVAQDVMWVDRKQKLARVERRVGECYINHTGNIDNSRQKNEDYFGCEYSYVSAKIDRELNGLYADSLLFAGKNSTLNGSEVTFAPNNGIIVFGVPKSIVSEQTVLAVCDYLAKNPIRILYCLKEPEIEELRYSDCILATAQYQTNICFVDLDENLQPKITAQIKVLGR